MREEFPSGFIISVSSTQIPVCHYGVMKFNPPEGTAVCHGSFMSSH